MVKEYTQIQDKGFSKSFDYWMVFISDEGNTARLEGFYKVLDEQANSQDVMPQGYPIPEEFNGERSYFSLEKLDTFSDYEKRLVIDWGKATIAWHQKGTIPKPIIALQAVQKVVFEGFEKINLSFEELTEILNNTSVYENWHTAMSAVHAVYLIVDTLNGKQYVGSTYNHNGLLGRWKVYAETKHGGNVRMMKLLEEQPERYRTFKFSVLQILPKNASVSDILDAENLWKDKLLTREFGLNGN